MESGISCSGYVRDIFGVSCIVIDCNVYSIRGNMLVIDCRVEREKYILCNQVD